MSFSLAGALLLIGAAASFIFRMKHGIYSRYPVEQFLFVGAALVLGLFGTLRDPGLLSLALLAVEIGAFTVVLIFFGVGSRFPRDEGRMKVGSRFPEFVLPDSDGGSFDSQRLLGSAAALYVFYRGHF
jgi:hypothetical protein